MLVDSSGKESVKSDRDSMAGYSDPCAPDESPISNINSEDIYLENSLSQNYPNPFNPLTRINYVLENDGVVRIFLYDVSGRRIAILVNQYKISGECHLEFDAHKYNLSSGIYFYRIEANNFTETRRMLLLK